ncbi:hypothetical protein GCM10027399_08160 [Curvibacter fontanus]|jgi:ElaB/YqjD/DUF883 family membrane-anchored ribosome-binding protein
MPKTIVPKKDGLIDDLRQVITDAEELLHVTADGASDSVAEVRRRIQGRLQAAQVELGKLQEATLIRVKAAGDATDEFVHQNPWASIGVSAALGLILGLVIARRH